MKTLSRFLSSVVRFAARAPYTAVAAALAARGEQPLQLNGLALSEARTFGGSEGDAKQAFASVRLTAFAESLTPGVTLISGSGHGYALVATAAPEPGAAALLSAVILALVALPMSAASKWRGMPRIISRKALSSSALAALCLAVQPTYGQSFGVFSGGNAAVTAQNGVVTATHSWSKGADFGGDYYVTDSWQREAAGNQSDAFASVNGIAELGRLRANGHSLASDADAPNGELAASSTNSDNRWNDLLQVTSATLAVGTPVELNITLQLDGLLSANPNILRGPTEANVFTEFSVFSPGKPGSVDIRFDYSFSAPAQSQQTVSFSSAVGDKVRLYGDLNTHTFSRADYTYRTSEALANFGGTAHFYVDAVTPGASYTTASGHSYVSAQAAPEPAALTLAFIGLTVVWPLVRRRI